MRRAHIEACTRLEVDTQRIIGLFQSFHVLGGLRGQVRQGLVLPLDFVLLLLLNRHRPLEQSVFPLQSTHVVGVQRRAFVRVLELVLEPLPLAVFLGEELLVLGLQSPKFGLVPLLKEVDMPLTVLGHVGIDRRIVVAMDVADATALALAREIERVGVAGAFLEAFGVDGGSRERSHGRRCRREL